jgi:hypothetical protein
MTQLDSIPSFRPRNFPCNNWVPLTS